MLRNGRLKSYICIWVLICLNINRTESFHLKITKVQCNILDKSVAVFEACRVRAVSRDLQYVQLHVNFYELPITHFKGDFRFMKKANGFKPFLYNFTLTCNFLKHLNPVKTIVWTWIKDSTNINHSCPIDTNFRMPRLENLYVERSLQILPVPMGEYALFIHWTLNNRTAFDTNIFGTIF